MGAQESSYQQYINQNYCNFGYRVVAVFPNSPACISGIEAQLDFILHNQQRQGDLLLSDYLQYNQGREVILDVYNIIQQEIRLVKVKLNEINQESKEEQPSILGTTIRFEEYKHAHLYILAIVDVYLGGPANKAGINPDKTDYIIGTREICFKSLEDFEKYIIINEGQEIILHIYNVVEERVREVEIVPNSSWGGKGLLGCDVSFGYFNQIPFRKIDVIRMKQRGDIIQQDQHLDIKQDNNHHAQQINVQSEIIQQTEEKQELQQIINQQEEVEEEQQEIQENLQTDFQQFLSQEITNFEKDQSTKHYEKYQIVINNQQQESQKKDQIESNQQQKQEIIEEKKQVQVIKQNRDHWKNSNQNYIKMPEDIDHTDNKKKMFTIIESENRENHSIEFNFMPTDFEFF